MLTAVTEIGGNTANYIPELGAADPELFGAALVTVDGQVWYVGAVHIHIHLTGMAGRTVMLI